VTALIANEGLIEGADRKVRCWWHGGHNDYVAYHDQEWGRPVDDDRRLFEKICLEGFQAGLSWLTILRKRESFRAAMTDFNFERLAGFEEEDVVRLLANADIIRHRKKIESAINNARQALELRDEFGSLAAYFWRYEPAASERPNRLTRSMLQSMATTERSTALSKDLKKRGWSFVGPTTVYAFMQAMGLVNDHLDGCFRRAQLEAEREAFVRPK
jgi:DNA-3-methyladenine glycosylase I